MDFFYLYLLGAIGIIIVPFLIVLFIAWLITYCKRHIGPVRHQQSWLPRQNLMPNVHFPDWKSLWPCRNGTRANIPLTQWRSPIITSVHRMPYRAHQSNVMTDVPPATNQSQRTTTPLPSAQYITNAGIAVPFVNQQSSRMVPLGGGCCRTNQGNILANVPLQTFQPQMMTPMHYRPQTNGRSHTPHRPHQNNSQTNANLPHATHQRQMMAPEPREGPKCRNSDICAYISAFIYQKYENDKNTECVVCLAELKRDEMVMRMPACSHLYHEKCICQWLLQDPSCPLCRSPIRAQLSVRVGHS